MGVAVVVIKEISMEDPLYQVERRVRGKVLREPLGMGSIVEVFPFEHEALHFVAMRGEVMVGCVLFHPRGEEGRLFQMAVLEECRGQGIGRLLVDYLERDVAERGFARVFLHSRDYAAEFYKHLGYQVQGEPFLEIGIQHFRMVKHVSEAV